MNLSLNWLKRYIDLNLEIDKLSEILTDIGLEVEGIEKVETIKGGLEGIVIGHVVECGKHPNADKLSLTKVNIGELELKQIVCGAPNIEVGQKVLVATIGTTLYSEEGPWKIKKGKIRGEESEGMICAEDELGLGTDHDGIVVLPEDVPVGTLAKDYYKIEDDWVFDIGLTPNRSDATSHLGVAKDLAAYLKINEGWEGQVKEPDVIDFQVEIDNPPFKINIENEVACPRYSGISLSNIKVGDSPAWMQDLLKVIGVRPINNIVDITNFILHEMGQPLHAFDAHKIAGQTVRIKTLAEGSKFSSLDEKERILTDKDLMICDGQDNPLCMAGVFGGLNSGVTEATTDIFLESAHFDAGYIRRTSTHHLLRTDAAKVFEKGSDPNITTLALERAALLMAEYANATISSRIEDVYPNRIDPQEIHVNYQRVNKLIGAELEIDEMHAILRAMDMELRPVDAENMIVIVPTNKADVIREIDVIEEILRIYGFNKVGIPTKLQTNITFQKYPTKRQVQNSISNLLVDNGFNEMMGMSLIESNYYEDKSNLVFINNTSNIHLDIMRPDALLSGLRSVAHNINHKQTNIQLFEFGRTYKQLEEFEENEFLSLFVSGANSRSTWNHKEKVSDFFEIKKWVHRILERAGVSGFQVKELDNGSAYSVGLSYYRGDKVIVNFGSIQKKVLKKMDIGNAVFYAEFNFKALVKAAGKSQLKIKEVSKYPSSDRDLSLVIDNKVKFEEIVAITKKTEKKLISEISLFDVYANEDQLGVGKKSYAIRFVFQDSSKTLKDKDIDKVMSQLMQQFKEKLSAEIRS